MLAMHKMLVMRVAVQRQTMIQSVTQLMYHFSVFILSVVFGYLLRVQQ